MTCPLFSEIFIALIASELFSALSFLVPIKKTLNFSSFFVQFVFECRFYSFLNFLWHLRRFSIHNKCSSCLVLRMGNFRLRVVSGILPAMFVFKICSHIFMIFEVKLE